MPTRRKSTIRYAVVGLGYIAQAAVLPAFRHASSNSQLVALVSGDAEKRAALERWSRRLTAIAEGKRVRVISTGRRS